MTWRIVWIMTLVLCFDQASKLMASAWLSYGQPMPVLPIMSMTLLHNEGAAFSFLADAGGWQRWFFLGIALAVTVYCIYTLIREPLNPWMQAGYVLLVPGALGNAFDRAVFGYVVDFVHLHWGNWSFPAFNIADTSITLAAGCLLIGWYLDARSRPEHES
jgi:signal peptidase II